MGIVSVVPLTVPCALRSTEPLKVSTRDFSWGKGGRCVWLTTYYPCSAETSRKSGALNYPEPLGPPRPVPGHLYFTLLYFTLLYSTLLYSTLLYSTLLYFTLLILLYFTLLYFTLLYFALLYFTLLYFTLLYFTLLYFTRTQKQTVNVASIQSGCATIAVSRRFK